MVEAHVPLGGEGEAMHERRRAAIATTIPGWYVPALHLAAPTAVSLGVMVGALTRIHALRPLELLTVPLTLFLAFGFEDIDNYNGSPYAAYWMELKL